MLHDCKNVISAQGMIRCTLSTSRIGNYQLGHAQTADVIVIGAGAVGCAIALNLTRSGITPLIIERDDIAFNASGYAWGGLSAHFGSGVPGPMTEIYRKSIAKHIELYEELSPTATNDWELQKVTSMTLADDEAKADQLKSDIEWMQSEGFDAELIGDEQIYRMEPAIRGGMIAASVVNAGWELDSYSYTKSIASEAERRGLTITTGKVAAFDTRGGRISSVTLADGKKIDTHIVVAATGPWTNQIQGMPRLPVKPIKGEILRLSRPDNDLQNRIGFNGFNVGRKPNGSVWAGTYEWDRGFNREITEEGRNHIFNGVTDYLPSLAKSEITEATACLRPVAVDGFPIVGASSIAEGLFYANGAGKKGILLSPLIADWIVGLIQSEIAPPSIVSSTRFPEI